MLDSQCLGALLLQVDMVGSAAEAPPLRLRRRGSAAQAPPQRLAWLSSTGTARCSSPSARKKQTEKCHVTDVRMSKIAKDAQDHFACLMYDLLAAEHPRAVLQVDMVGCEHTQTCLAVKYTNSQVQRTISQKQTEKCQITDVRMARIAKDAQRAALPALRSAQRRLAAKVGMAPADGACPNQQVRPGAVPLRGYA